MDYHNNKMIGTTTEQKIKKEEEEDEDLEALRLAALQSLRTKDTVHNKKANLQLSQPIVPHVTQSSRIPFKSIQRGRGGFYHNRLHARQTRSYNHLNQNGNVYYQSPRNPNLIAIVLVDEDSAKKSEGSSPEKVEKTDSYPETVPIEVSKFHRFKDAGSGSEDEDVKDNKNTQEEDGKVELLESENPQADSNVTADSNAEKGEESPAKNDEEEEETNDDDDDILLMADLEEEDSLERLMDEMEKEMSVDKTSDRKQGKSCRKERKQPRKYDEPKSQEQKVKVDDANSKRNSPVSSTVVKNERRSISPHNTTKISQKRRSLSPKPRSRKRSPRRSPRRSPVRAIKKLQRETLRYKSPRKSPPRYSPRSRSPRLSPRPRSPRLSPRRSPNRSPVRRSPMRKLSPRGRSPRLSPINRSPKRPRSRSPTLISRSKSPRPPRSPKVSSRSRSPRMRSRSPRFSPIRHSSRSPRSKSPRGSPRRNTPPRRSPPRRISPCRRASPRLRSPGLSPRRGSPRQRSPKLSPRRISPRLPRSPKLSPHRSPWSSPRNSPRLSPRRRRSPQWSPKDVSRKHGTRSISPDHSNSQHFARDSSPMPKGRPSPETGRARIKQREESNQKNVITEATKDYNETMNDPVLEARRRKFGSTKPIDPINANKKIKLSRKDNAKKAEPSEEIETTFTNVAKIGKSSADDYDVDEAELCFEDNYELDDLEGSMDNASPVGITSSISIEVEQPKLKKDKKKKKKRDKEIYQVGRLKGELPLSERIGKEKKKKRKDLSETSSEEVEAIFEDLAVDEEGDLRSELSRRRAERLNRAAPIQSARLVQSAFKGVVNEVVKNNAKVNQRHVIKGDEKSAQKEVRRVTVLHRTVSDLHDSGDDSALDSKVPVRFRLGLNKQVQDTRESKASRKTSKRQGRKVKHKHLSLVDSEHTL